MEYNKYKNILKQVKDYPSETNLIYKYGFTREELKTIYNSKYTDSEYLKLPLNSPQEQPLIYLNNDLLKWLFIDAHNLIKNSTLNLFADLSDSEILNGFIFLEIESSLAIEGVRSTRAQIERLSESNYDSLTETNDIIVKNMLIGYEFVKKNKITEENIYKLYQILSKKSLKLEEELKPGNYYRHDEVNIIDGAGNVVDRGVDYNQLPKLMKELITYINQTKTFEDHLIASHIIHYYLVYIHPYFDYNGRMARVISFWYNYSKAPSLSLLLVSEAINNKIHKNDYYNAIMNSRKANNDITFFLEYMGQVVLEYSKVYVNFYSIIDNLKHNGNILTRSLELALKQILAMPTIGKGYFSWKDYKRFSHDDYSKQYYLRLLNELVELNILELKVQKNANLYRIKSNIRIYE